MSHPVVIAPSILSADHANFDREIKAIEKAGADWVHVDVMDGHFVPNLTFGPPVIASLRKSTKLPFDVHLMIEKPELSIEQYVKAGADYVTVHAEASVHLQRTVTHIRSLGAKSGVSINPSTPVSTVELVLPYVDLVLVMSVNPGFSGQSFIPESIDKVRSLAKARDEHGLDFRLEVDGGISPKTVGDVARAGADTFVAGSAVFGASDYQEAIGGIRSKAQV